MKNIQEKITGLLWAAAALFTAVVLIGHAASCAAIPAREFYFNDFSLLNYTAEAARRFHDTSGALWGLSN